MKYIFILIGESGSGKDTIYNILLDKFNESYDLDLVPIVRYTTRDIRPGEVNHKTYHFITKNDIEDLTKIIQQTKYNEWDYITTEDCIDLNKTPITTASLDDCREIMFYYNEWYNNTPAVVNSIKEKVKVQPIYIQTSDKNKLLRSITRVDDHYEEICRRFLSDKEQYNDFSLKDIGITGVTTFSNDFEDPIVCATQVAMYIEATLLGDNIINK